MHFLYGFLEAAACPFCGGRLTYCSLRGRAASPSHTTEVRPNNSYRHGDRPPFEERPHITSSDFLFSVIKMDYLFLFFFYTPCITFGLRPPSSGDGGL